MMLLKKSFIREIFRNSQENERREKKEWAEYMPKKKSAMSAPGCVPINGSGNGSGLNGQFTKEEMVHEETDCDDFGSLPLPGRGGIIREPALYTGVFQRIQAVHLGRAIRPHRPDRL